jgi:putative tryptophan/tyrosine transport system substrate-binding protein
MKRRRFGLSLVGAMISVRGLGAQQQAMPVIGFLNSGSPGGNAPFIAGFLMGLSETGYVDGQNVAIEYRWGGDRYDRLPALVADLIGRKVDLIAAGNFPAALAAKNATSTIPIIFEVGVDPVEGGLVASFSRPGGNLTGISSLSIELTPKLVELLSELVPPASVIALLVNPTNPTTERVVRDAPEAANAKGRRLRILKAGVESEIDTAFVSLAELRAGALVVPSDPFFNTHVELLVTLAARHGVPTIHVWREFVAAGGLISYGPSLPAAFRQVGNYVGQILKGAKPAELPVHRATIFDLVINLRTAKALGLTVPQSILTRADEVIE